MHLRNELEQICRDALQQSALSALHGALYRLGHDAQSCHVLVRSVADDVATHQPIVALKRSLEHSGAYFAADGDLERYLLLSSALHIAAEIETLPIANSVKNLYRDEFNFFAAPASTDMTMFQAGTYRFTEMCKIASLRRFPAGQMQWEISGIARSTLLHISPRQIPKAMGYLLSRLKGRRPCFNAHLNGRRKNRLILVEAAQHESYFRMAKSMELQPEILGYISSSWIYSPATAKASPHLAWLGEFFEENDGMVVDLGPVGSDCGALVGSRQRRALWEQGSFRPRRALVIWPRAAVLRWASAYAGRVAPSAASQAVIASPAIEGTAIA